jgi:hypothetical protein
LLALATLATAWSGYVARCWNIEVAAEKVGLDASSSTTGAGVVLALRCDRLS